MRCHVPCAPAGTLNLLAVMEKHKCYKLVFSSSATVYGAAAVPIPETAPLSATNAYGRTKLFIEQILQDLGTCLHADM